jgi:ABC-type multidrug transport system ATPase subunit
MLTTDFEQTKGDILIAQENSINKTRKNLLYSLSHKRSYWKNIGYCPQFDALYDELTPADHLRLFARLKGIKSEYEKIIVKNLLRRLDLLQYQDKSVGSLSLGNKRKLSTALALVGNPSVIFLDEPTSGMDPCSRRQLWECILDLTRNKNQSVLLTSHSMEECEVLCTRIAFMVDGKFKCLGSVQHLKTRFGDGYTLTVKIKESDDELINMNNFNSGDNHSLSLSSSSSCSTSYSQQSTQSLQIQKILNTNKYISIINNELIQNISSKCRLKERHFNNVYQFEIPYGENVCLGEIYRLIELNKLKFNIIDYSLTQNTLDNVFINFIKEHTDKRKQKLLLLNKQYINENDTAAANLDYDLDDELIDTNIETGTSNEFKFKFPLNDEHFLLSSSLLQQSSIVTATSVEMNENSLNSHINKTLNSSTCSKNNVSFD